MQPPKRDTHKLAQSFRFDKAAATRLDTGETLDEITPYIALPLMIQQVAGPKHKSKDYIRCWPEEPRDQHFMVLCDDGAEFMVVGVSFPGAQ